MYRRRPPLPRLVEARRAVVELEAPVPAEALLEELCKLAPGEAAMEWVPALLRHGIVRVVAIVEPLTKFWFAENLVGFVHGSHLGFAATLVGMSLHSCFPAD